ncbi:NAD-dependent epimerase/dehydratase family protein [Streptomyces phyllanthi]|uniref:NAD-dependent epimerase/dehydratase family protein n=1 Tax=Streptomyces phyllanthi TaxID=1803180 RepID=A0A5N8WBI3_9ACTN|nr:NAD-dependent epimerase/dehydratase family protein [Streptomyces phyllanthi]MPY44669.1 NAD-dependent epimerase/dehydratase family protein [Streptomyces phyllanthi]
MKPTGLKIVGNGFLARHLRAITPRHTDAVVLAAGVSWASHTSAADFARETDLVERTIRECRAAGRRLVFFSTASTGMYGTVNGPGREDVPVTPCTPYGAHKLALEERLRACGVEFLALRLGHLVGPGQPPHQLLPTLLRQLREGAVFLHRGATRDLIHIDDVVTVVDRLLAAGLAHETVNVASGTAVPVERIVDHLEARTGLTARRVHLDLGRHHTISTDKLRALVPEVDAMGFGPDYHRGVLDDFLAASASTAAP